MSMERETALKTLFNPIALGTAFGTYIVSICAIVCCGFDKKVPVNYVLLAIFTGSVSWLVGGICLMYNPVIVMEAAGLTAAVVVALTFYAITTKNDFTVFGPILFILGFLLCTAGIMAFFFGLDMHLLYCVLGVFIFSFYLVIDTQMIIGGTNKRYTIGVDSYILASVILYLDIINLFLEILKLLGNK